MGDLANDTAVQRQSDGVYTTEISKEWEWLGPHGGYLATLMLRAAGAQATLPRPANLACHYLRAPTFAPVELRVETLRRTARAEVLRVRMVQNDDVVVEATVRTAAQDMWGPDAVWGDRPDGPPPESLPMNNAGAEQPFWQNFDIRDIPQDPALPCLKGWKRFTPRATFPDDPWTDAGRSVVAMDVIQFPAIARVHDPLMFVVATLDLHVQFHRLLPEEEWLLVEAEGTAAWAGLLEGHARAWSAGGALVASSTQQMLCRPMPGATG